MHPDPDRPLRCAVVVAAIAAPVLHSATDAMEWVQGGFSPLQLWLNYVAFLPMPWLLLGLYAVHRRALGAAALAGALLHGVAFTYFAHTTLLALDAGTTDYATLWQRLGHVYTVHGALMVAGGLLFAADAWRSAALPRGAVALFAGGLLVNLAVALVPVPDIAQTLGTLVRNAGLVAFGVASWRARGSVAA